jgi:cytokinesis protein
MATIFRKRRTGEARPRQVSAGLDERSVPYDRTAPGRAPVPISAPITNPTLTASGTQLNIHAMNRSRFERERAYELARSRTTSPNLDAGDSSMLSTDSTNGPPTPSAKSNTAAARRTRQSNASTASGRTSDSGHLRTPSMTGLDLGSIPSPPTSARSPGTPNRPSSSTVARPGDRSSRYAPSEFSTETAFVRHLRSRAEGDTFVFDRPPEEEIEALYENLLLNREIKDLPNVDIEHKWMMVFNAEHLRWSQERESRKAQEREARKAGMDSAVDAVAAANIENTPEFFMKKFMDKTITVKQAQSLEVSLRSGELACVALLVS